MNKSIYINSPGRCGSHWLRNILIALLGLKQTRIGNWSNEDRIYNDHRYFPELRFWEDRMNILVMIRDPRDVCVSAVYYMLYINRMRSDELQECLSNFHCSFMSNNFNELMDHYKNEGFNIPWFESYVSEKNDINHVLIKYEDMIQNGVQTVRDFLIKCRYDCQEIEEVFKKHSFRKLTGRFPGEENVMNHNRKGIVGDWRNYFTEYQNRAFCKKFGHILNAIGYSLTGV